MLIWGHIVCYWRWLQVHFTSFKTEAQTQAHRHSWWLTHPRHPDSPFNLDILTGVLVWLGSAAFLTADTNCCVLTRQSLAVQAVGSPTTIRHHHSDSWHSWWFLEEIWFYSRAPHPKFWHALQTHSHLPWGHWYLSCGKTSMCHSTSQHQLWDNNKIFSVTTQ